MVSRSRLGFAVSAAVAASAIGISASALASSRVPNGNNNRSGTAASQGWSTSGVGAGGSTHSLSLAASAFAPDNGGDSYENVWDPANLTQSQGCSQAGVTLPYNATLKSVTLYYTAEAGALSFELNRQDLPNHTYTLLAEFSNSSHSTTGYTKVTKKINSTQGKVAYSKYAYGIGVCDRGDTFSGVTFTYTTP